MMYEYDVVTMCKIKNQWKCQSNTAQTRTLDENVDQSVVTDGYAFVEISEGVVEIIVNRLDTQALAVATHKFHETYK